MTIEHVNQGDEFSFQANTYNEMANAANAHQANLLLRQQRTDLQFENNGTILVRNNTGSDRARFDIAAFGGTLIDPTVNESGYLSQAAYDVVLPEDADGDISHSLVILQEPLAIDKIGLAVVCGISRATVRENDATHRYATWGTDPSILESTDIGPIKILSMDGGAASERFALVQLQQYKGDNRWRRIFDYTKTAPSTSTITTDSDLRSFIKLGDPIKIVISDAAPTATPSGGGPLPINVINQYAIVTAITSSLITISGPAIPTSSDGLLEMYIGDPEMISMLSMFVSGTYGDATDNNLLASDMLSPMKWMESTHYLVRVSAIQMTVDTGTEPSINVQLNNANALSTAIQLGAAATWIDNAAAAFNATNYSVEFDEEVELACTIAGGTGNASDLTVQCVFVAE